jgi:hypothetical protein
MKKTLSQVKQKIWTQIIHAFSKNIAITALIWVVNLTEVWAHNLRLNIISTLIIIHNLLINFIPVSGLKATTGSTPVCANQ